MNKLDTFSRYKNGKYKFFEENDKDAKVIELLAKVDEGKISREEGRLLIKKILLPKNPVFQNKSKQEQENDLKEELNFYNSKIYCPVCFSEGIKSNKHIKKRYYDAGGWNALAGRAGDLYYCEKHNFDIEFYLKWMS